MKCPGCGLEFPDDARQAAPPAAQEPDSDEDIVRRLRREQVLTTRQVCRLLQISDETLAQRILRGAVPQPYERRPRRWRASEFFAWLDAPPVDEGRRHYFTRARAARAALRVVGER